MTNITFSPGNTVASFDPFDIFGGSLTSFSNFGPGDTIISTVDIGTNFTFVPGVGLEGGVPVSVNALPAGYVFDIISGNSITAISDTLSTHFDQGIVLASGSISNGMTITGTGAIQGNTGGSAYAVYHYGFLNAAGHWDYYQGGNGQVGLRSGGIISNDGNINGGLGGAGQFEHVDNPNYQPLNHRIAAGNGAIGVALYGGTLFNQGVVQGGGIAGPTIRGAYGYSAYGGNGGVGVALYSGALANAGAIRGGAGNGTYNGNTGGAGGGGVAASGIASITNTGAITGGSGGDGGPGDFAPTAGPGGVGGFGVSLTGAGSLFNSGHILGGNGGAGLGEQDNGDGGGNGGGGGNGVDLAGGATFFNNGLIQGGNGGPGGAAGADSANYPAGATGTGGVGVYLNGGVLIDSGTIISGSGNNADSVQFGAAAGTLILTPSAVFSGLVVANIFQDDVLELSGAGTNLIKLGSEFVNFLHVSFAAGAAWTVGGRVEGPGEPVTFSGFAAGDRIIDYGVVVTSATPVSGNELLLDGGTYVLYVSPLDANEVLKLSTDGVNSTFQAFLETISTAVQQGIVLDSTVYGDILTITAAGVVAASTGAAVQGASSLGSGTDTLTNAGNIYGGIGAAGVVFSNGGTVGNTGHIQGGAGTSYVYGDLAGGIGGVGLALSGRATATNTSLIQGGNGGGGGGAGAVQGGAGGNGGIGVALSGAMFFNAGNILGGIGGNGGQSGGQNGTHANGGIGGAGIALSHGSSLGNTSFIEGGGGGGGSNFEGGLGGKGGSGAVLSGSALANTGLIEGGGGGNGGSGLTNILHGGLGGRGGFGVALSGGATLSNNGSIMGGAGGTGGFGNAIGSASGAGGNGGNGGAGVYLNGGILLDGGTISGGAAGMGGGATGPAGKPGRVGDAVLFGSAAGILVVESGAVFNGKVVANAGVADVLELSGSAVTKLTGIGTEFLDFNDISFAAGAAWTIEGNVAGLATHQTISGFAVGDSIILDGFVATTDSFTSNGLILNGGAKTLHIGALVSGEAVNITSDGTNSTISLFNAVTNLSTSLQQSVTLDSEPFINVLTIASTGAVYAGFGIGVQGGSAPGSGADMLRNAGMIYGGLGSAGVALSAGATLANTGLIHGGFGANPLIVNAYGDGGAGVALSGSTLINSGVIQAGDGAGDGSSNGNAGGTGGNGGIGVTLSGSGGSNTGAILGGGGYQGGAGYGYAQGGTGGSGGTGLALSGGRLTNTGSIRGGSGGDAGHGVLQNGNGGNGGAGVYLNGGTLIDAGAISGGSGGGVYQGGNSGSDGAAGDAVRFGGLAGTLAVEAGAAFNGLVVANAAIADVLELSGNSAARLTGIGTQFLNFNNISFATGAAWTIEGDAAGLAAHQTISGFAAGDAIILDGFAATASSFIPGTGLVLNHGAETLDLQPLSAGSVFALTSDGINTTITVNDVPALTAPSTATIGVGKAAAISGLSLAEAGNTTGESFTVKLSDTNGLLSATGAGITGSGTRTLTLSGTLAQVNADLATLKDTDSVAATDTITLSATDGYGNVAAKTTTISVNGLPTLTAPTTAIVGIGKATSITGLSLTETGNTTGESFTVKLSDTHGLLSATGTGVTGSGTGTLTLSGTLAQVNADLATLKDTDGASGADAIKVNAKDSLGNPAARGRIAVTPHLLPLITAPATASITVGKAGVIAGVSLAEIGNVPGETFTVTLDDTIGKLGATGTGVAGAGTTKLKISGTLAQVNADLATLTDTDGTSGADTITVNAKDSHGNVATPATIAGTATSFVAASTTMTVNGTQAIANILNNGTVNISSGSSLDITSALDPASNGIFDLTTKGSLEIAAVLDTNVKIAFLGTTPANKLTIDQAFNFGLKVGSTNYGGPLLEEFNANNIIDLNGIASAGLELAYAASAGILQIASSAGAAFATLKFENSTLGTGMFRTTTDGAGGTLLTHS